MLIRLLSGEILKATDIRLMREGTEDVLFVENWDDGVREFFILSPDEVLFIGGRRLKSWRTL